MNKLIGIAAASLLVLASCQVPFTGAGAVRISLANGAHSLSRVPLTAGTDHVRIQLLRNGNIVPQDGQDYQDVVFANQTVTIDQLAPGTGYKILVSAGTATSSGFFQVKDYGASDPFEITAGVESAVSVSAPDTPVTLVKQTDGSRGAAAVVNSQLYVLAGHLILKSANGSSFSDTSTSVGSSYKVNSFAMGLATTTASVESQQLWVNTDQGISVATEGSPLPAPVILGKDDNGVATSSHDNVLFSGSVAVVNDIGTNPDGKTYYLHLYGGDGISAGARFEKSGSPDSTWYSVNGKLDSLPTEVTDVLGKSGSLFLGYAKADSFAYIATSLGVYRISKKMVTDGQNSSLQFFDPAFPLSDPLDETHHKVTIGLADTSAKAQFVSYAVSGTNSQVFVGSNKGLFSGPVDTTTGQLTNTGVTVTYDATYTDTDADGNALPDPADSTKHKRVTVPGKVDYLAPVVAGTEGLSITKVVSIASGTSDIYTAAFSATTREILVLKNSSVVGIVPLFAGLPSGRLDLVWFNTGAGLLLVASGDDGVVTIDPTKIK